MLTGLRPEELVSTKPFAAVLALTLATPLTAQTRAPELSARIERHRATANRLIDRALADSAAWNKLAELTDRFGHRFSGSASLERAIDWIIERMNAESFENVRGEEVMVPRWVRGRESAELIEPRPLKLPMLGLGGSIATPAGGITADVLVVGDYEELASKAAQVQGKIVLFDVPFTNYGQTVQYRGTAAIEAAKLGAVAAMIRSVGPYGLRSPHTGSMRYDPNVTRIPAFAITMEDASMLHRMQTRGQRIVVKVEMEAEMQPDVPSRNVIGEIKGRERPDEIVVIGGHIDSWDVGTGAVDDAGGVVVAWEAVRLMHELGLRPRRTIRVVGWTNEENGGRGAQAYRDTHRDALPKHVLALESDGGVFRPRGFGFTGPDSMRAVIREIATLLRRVEADSIGPAGGGADIGPLMQLGVPGMSHVVDGTRYFWFHHSEADNVDKLDPRDVAMNVAAIAVMAWIIAEELGPTTPKS